MSGLEYTTLLSTLTIILSASLKEEKETAKSKCFYTLPINYIGWTNSKMKTINREIAIILFVGALLTISGIYLDFQNLARAQDRSHQNGNS